MSSSILLSIIISTLMHLATARNQSQLQDCTGSAEYCWNCSTTNGNYTPKSTYQYNLDSLLLSISSSVDDQSDYLFYNASLGENPDKVNAISLCRGGLALESCQKCLNDTSHMLLERCPIRKEAILWGERCMVRYSSKLIFSVKADEPNRVLPSPNEAADAEQFKEVLKPLLDDLISKAASDVHKYAYNSAKVPNSEPIYALVQCTTDLSQEECSDCLQDASLMIPDCCYGKNGARILKPSCNLRYESGPFYDNNGPEDNGICTQTAEFCWNCFDVSNDSGVAIFEENLKKLLSSFSSNSTRNSYGFYNSSLGENENRINAMAICRGDLLPETCQSCISNSSERLLGRCPNRKEAILWDEQCMVRYSNRSIFSVRQDDPRKYVPSPNDAWEPNLFKIKLKPLLDNLISKAAFGDSLRKYASGQSTVPGYETIYATVQCTPDLNEQQCSGCLQEATLFIPQQFGGKQGARILKPSCNLRYEVSQFFVPTADPPVSPSSSKGKSNTTRTIVASIVPTFIVMILIFSVCVFQKMMKKPSEKLGILEADKEISWAESLQFDFETIRSATDDFSDENKLGQGGFGAVYRGRLSNGQLIAVKRLSESSGQGDEEFKNEVQLVAKLQHRNLVRLLGFCLDEKERLLVYEYVPNSSLDKFIFDPIRRAELDWHRRYKIIQGIVRGLLYLHEDSRLRIIHRDLKASNILLDEEMNPKISDFGMARLFVIDQTQGNTNRIVGTYGYMAPEYVLHGQFSVKSDIFSFGVLLLEIVSGQKNSCIRNGEVEDLLTYAWQNWTEGTASNIIDPTILVGSRAEIMRCIHVGLLCVQENVADRPTMNSIVLMFNSHSTTLASPSKPAFFMHSITGPQMPTVASDVHSDHSQNISVHRSRNEASISDVSPR